MNPAGTVRCNMRKRIELGRGDCNFRVRARFFATIVSAMTRPATALWQVPTAGSSPRRSGRSNRRLFQERRLVPSIHGHCREVAHAQTGLALTRPFLFLFQSAAPPTALSAAFPASVISYSMSCMLGDCGERLI